MLHLATFYEQSILAFQSSSDYASMSTKSDNDEISHSVSPLFHFPTSGGITEKQNRTTHHHSGRTNEPRTLFRGGGIGAAVVKHVISG